MAWPRRWTRACSPAHRGRPAGRPADWRGDPHRARARLLELSFNTGVRAAPLQLVAVCVTPGLAPFVRCPLQQVAPTLHADWEAFRHIGNPSLRRAALWVAAWECVPNLSDLFNPDYFPPRTP